MSSTILAEMTDKMLITEPGGSVLLKKNKNAIILAKLLDNMETVCYTMTEARACAQAFGTSDGSPESDLPEGQGTVTGPAH